LEKEKCLVKERSEKVDLKRGEKCLIGVEESLKEDEENCLIGEEEVHKEKEGDIFAVYHSDETKDFSKEKKAQKLRQQELEVEIVF